MPRILLTFLILAPLTVFSAPSKIPADSQVLSEVGKKDPAIKLPNRVNLMVWNMLKGENAGWEQEFDAASAGANLILLQEGMLNPATKKGITATRTDFLYTFAASFYWEEFLTGIYTGAPALPIGRKFFRSVDREPFTKTPKMGLRMDYVLESGKVLRVMNIHSLNFTDDAAHGRQITQVIDDLRTHDGPIILAGDFNIFNEVRWAHVESSTKSVGLVEVPVNDKPSVQNLDHIFVRGCDARNAWEKDTPASDHAMIFAELECE